MKNPSRIFNAAAPLIAALLFPPAVTRRAIRTPPPAAPLNTSMIVSQTGDPRLRIVSRGSVPIRIRDVVINGKYRVFGFCAPPSDRDLTRLGIPRYDTEIGSYFPRYLPGDTALQARLRLLGNGCEIPGKDSLLPGDSMDLRPRDFGEAGRGVFHALPPVPFTLSVETGPGTDSFRFAPR